LVVVEIGKCLLPTTIFKSLTNGALKISILYKGVIANEISDKLLSKSNIPFVLQGGYQLEK
jgi:hypothetical protein